jgi:hypothetical protein
MIIVNIKGGLGNQMFQYACGRALALKNKDSLFLVRSEYQGDVDRPFSLTNFNIQAVMMRSAEVPKFSRFFSRVTQKLTGNFHVAFDQSVLDKQGTVYLDGYFQSEKYFNDITDKIRQDFTVAEPFQGKTLAIANSIKNDPAAVSLHVRRGDYITHPDFGGIVTTEYYERAIDRVREKIPAAKFYVFSDDITWCKSELGLGSDTTFVSHPELKDFEELILMSLCKHHIIANSSFSWWGAWLGQNPKKTVIAPKTWSNLHEDWYKDIIPDLWVRI